MKKLLCLCSLLALLFAMIGCGDEGNKKQTEQTIKITSGATQTLYADETEAHPVSFTATDIWTASIAESASYISINPKSGLAGASSIAVTLAINTSGADRTAKITIVSGDNKVQVTVTQKSMTEDGKPPERIFTIIDSEKDENSYSFRATGVNNRGEVLGEYYYDDTAYPGLAIWTKEKGIVPLFKPLLEQGKLSAEMQDLLKHDRLLFSDISYSGINDNGDVVGVVEIRNLDANEEYAGFSSITFLLSRETGEFTQISQNDLGYPLFLPVSVNNHGEVLGRYPHNDDYEVADLNRLAIWTKEKGIVPLELSNVNLVEFGLASESGINDNGDVVGTAIIANSDAKDGNGEYTDKSRISFLLSRETGELTVIDSTDIDVHDSFSILRPGGVTNRGEVLVRYRYGSLARGLAIWTKGKGMVPLATPELPNVKSFEFDDTKWTGISSNGDVVGRADIIDDGELEDNKYPIVFFYSGYGL